jgi:hypothetical protein
MKAAWKETRRKRQANGSEQASGDARLNGEGRARSILHCACARCSSACPSATPSFSPYDETRQCVLRTGVVRSKLRSKTNWKGEPLIGLPEHCRRAKFLGLCGLRWVDQDFRRSADGPQTGLRRASDDSHSRLARLVEARSGRFEALACNPPNHEQSHVWSHQAMKGPEVAALRGQRRAEEVLLQQRAASLRQGFKLSAVAAEASGGRQETQSGRCEEEPKDRWLNLEIAAAVR